MYLSNIASIIASIAAMSGAFVAYMGLRVSRSNRGQLTKIHATTNATLAASVARNEQLSVSMSEQGSKIPASPNSPV